MTRTAVGDGAARGRAEMQGQVIELLRVVARSLRRQHVRLAAGGGFPLSGRQAIGRLLQQLCDDELAGIASGLAALQCALRQAEEEAAEEPRTPGRRGGARSC